MLSSARWCRSIGRKVVKRRRTGQEAFGDAFGGQRGITTTEWRTAGTPASCAAESGCTQRPDEHVLDVRLGIDTGLLATKEQRVQPTGHLVPGLFQRSGPVCACPCPGCVGVSSASG